MIEANILYGRPDPDHFNFGKQSLGRIIFNRLKERDPLESLLVDVASGLHVTRKKCLEYSMNLSMVMRKQWNVNKGDSIGIVSENSWKFAISLVSSFFVGTTLCAINPNYTIDEMAHNLKITKPKLLFVSKKVLHKIESISKKVDFIKKIVILDSDKGESEVTFDEIIYESNNVDLFHIDESNPEETTALILYSSGTTGHPKGVILTQENVKSGMKLFMDPTDAALTKIGGVNLVYLPLFHIFGLLTLLTGITHASTNILMEEFKTRKFLELLQEYKITTVAMVPTVLHFLATSPIVENYDLSCLSDIISGGAPTFKELMIKTEKRIPHLQVRQVYGLTETTGAVTVIRPGTLGETQGSVGKLIAGHQMKIWDAVTNTNLGPFQRGEICVKGPSIMKGYKNNPEATKNAIDSDGYFRTGDAGFYDNEGNLYVEDRIKELIKYKGFQVPPAQLEGILIKHPAVNDACVVGKPDERAGELPMAFIVKEPNMEVEAEDIIQYVADAVSKEKHLHGGVVFVNAIPKSRTGKILRKDLRKLVINS